MSKKTITKQVNIAMSETDLNRMIELMAHRKTQNRSAFVRDLIDKAWQEHAPETGAGAGNDPR